MTATSFSAGISPLDAAFGKRLAGDREGALRQCIAILEAAPLQLGAATLLSWILVEQDRPFLAGEVSARLVDGFIRRGDLPSAVLAAHVADAAGEDGPALRRAIAQAFGRGSPRLSDVSASPPPLPTESEVAAQLQRLEGAALLDHAEQALQKVLAADDPVSSDAPVPELPLFSSLAPDKLESLLGAFEVRECDSGQSFVEQGTEGREAFVLARGALEVVRTSGEREVSLAALGPGAIFGEMALVSDAPRAASVRAVEPSLALVISRPVLEQLAAHEPALGQQLSRFCRRRMVSNLIRHSAILAAVAPEERQQLVDRFEAVTFEAGDALVREGDPGDGLFLIASGGVAVLGTDAEGDRVRLATLGPGDVVGEIALVLRRPATADVQAEHPTVALRLSREGFQEAIREHPGLLNELYAMATEREEETQSVVAQEALDVDDVVLL
jgi:cAMP-dependent protein kinase regulator